MPARYDHIAGAYRVTCANRCGTEVLVREHPQGRDVRGDTDQLTGRPTTDFFRTNGARGNYHSHCRRCQSQASPGRRSGPRVPGTHRVLSADQRRFGVELELIFPSGTTRESITAALSAAGLTGWRAKYDGSLSSGGFEVVSPILTGEDGETQIRTATRVLRGLGARPNRSCGLHVHHECRDLTAQGFGSLARGWAANQSLIDGLLSPSRRNGANHYCQPLSAHDVQQIANCTTVAQVQSRASHISRYKTINFSALGRFHTVEIRQHQGTCDAEKIISWVKFGQAIIAAAATTETSRATQQTHGRVRDLLGAFGSHLNETARTFLLGRAVEFGAVEV